MRTVFTRAECGELADGLSSLVPIVIQGGGDELDDASRLLRGFAEDDGVYEDWQERYEEFTNEHLRDVPEVPGGGDTGFLLRKKIIDMTLEPRSKGGFGALIMMEFRIGMPELPNTVQNSSWEEALAGMKRDGMPAHIGRLRNGYPVAWSENAPSPMRGSRRIEVFRQGLDTPIGVDRNYVHLLDVKHSPMPQSE